MGDFTAYDILIGMLKHFPEGKTTFRADYCDIIDFLDKELEKYPSLNRFTRSEIEGGLSTLIGGRMLQWNTAMPHIKQFKLHEINYAYTHFKKNELLGEEGLREVKDLSRNFVNAFG